MGAILVIVPCGSAKIWDRHPEAGPTPARDAYVGSPFKVNREYAERFADSWVVLSAKYGFLRPSDLVEGPYNVTFGDPSTGPIGADLLIAQIQERRLDRYDPIIGLGFLDYVQVISHVFWH